MTEAPSGRLRLLCLRLLVAFRWAALAGTLFYSFFHWMRAEYWEFGALWQYGLVLLDPRLPAALLWAFISALCWGLLLYPAARWLAPRLPQHGPACWTAVAALAIALGTRGVVGPLLLRAMLASPLRIALPGAIAPVSLLLRPDLARLAVLAADAWWAFPLLLLALRLLPARRPRDFRAFPLLIGLFALQEPFDAPYLLTAGGPHGATSNLQLLAFQEGFGRQEFGYASVLTVLLCAGALLTVEILLRSFHRPAEPGAPQKPLGPAFWVTALLAQLAIVVAALTHGAPGAAVGRSAVWALVSLGIAGAGAVWTVWLAAPLSRRVQEGLRGWRLRAWVWPALLPSLAWVLPLLRPLGYQGGALDVAVAPVALVLAAPGLYLAALALAGLQRSGVDRRPAALTAGLLTAWLLWTELSIPLLLQQAHHGVTPLTTGIVWELATRFHSSPLESPGWPVLWVGGSLLAAAMVFRCLACKPPAPQNC